MRQFLNVLRFEYKSVIKSKPFIVMTAILLILSIGLGFLPTITNMFGGGRETGDAESSLQPGKPGEGAKLPNAAIIDRDSEYPEEVLKTYFPVYTWVYLDDAQKAKNGVGSDEYKFAVDVAGTEFTMYTSGGTSFDSTEYQKFYDMVQTVQETKYLSEKGLSEADIQGLRSVVVSGSQEYMKKDYNQTFWLAYVMLILMYMTTILYGTTVLNSVAVEKSTKTMELLITSVKPNVLLFGKVIGSGLAGLTQFAVFIGVNIVSLTVNLGKWTDFSAYVGSIIDSVLNSNMLVFMVIFFLLGFFVFAFLFGAVGSTISRLEEASSVTALPMFLFVGAFLVAILGLTSPNAGYVTVCSYLPFFSPLVMFMRMCVLEIGALEIIGVIALNLAYIGIVGFLAARIYKVGVMMYGKPPKISTIIKYTFTK